MTTRENGAQKEARGTAGSGFEELAAAVSTRLIRAPAAELGRGIEAVLEWIGAFFETERVTVWDHREEKAVLARLSCWVAPDVAPALPEMPDELFPWVVRRLLDRKVVSLSGTEDLPPEAATDLEVFERMGIRSVLFLPLEIGDGIGGALSLCSVSDRRSWSKSSLGRVRLLGDAIAGAMARRKAWDEVQLSEHRARNFVSNSQEAIWCMEFGEPLSLDLPEEEAIEQFYRRGRMVETNDAMARIYGFADAEEMGEWTVADYFDRDSEATRESMLAMVRAGYRIAGVETIEAPPGGTPGVYSNNLLPEIVDGRLVRLWGTSRDVTDVRRAEEQLRPRSAAIEAMSSGCLVVDARTEEMPIVYANPGFLAMTGYELEEVLGVNCRFLQGSDTDPATRKEIRDALAGSGTFEGEILNYRKDGTPFWNHLRISPVRDSAGAVTHFVGIQTDVSKRREQEQDLGELRDELAHVARVATMGQLTGAIAHEINQPLTAIVSNALAGRRFLEAGEPDLVEVGEILGDMEADGRRAAEVMERTRALLERHETRVATVDLNGAITQVTALLHSEAVSRNIELELELDEDLPPARCDAVQMQQVLLNLILNGCEAMSDTPRNHRRLTVGTACDGDMIRVSVRDRGSGFREADPEELFVPYYTDKENGLGMGLAISRSIVEAHGGRIWARQDPRRGATFLFTLPAERAPGGSRG